jgi:putative two-component system response regulator
LSYPGPPDSLPDVSMSTEDAEGSPRILLVDDEPANVMLLQELLRDWGYRHVEATTDSTAVPQMFREGRPDLVLMDLSMPRLDGYALLELIGPENTGPERVPILVLTGDASREAKQRAFGLGASDFLTKPFDFDEVRARVANMLETRRLQLELANQNEKLERRVRARTRDLEQLRLELLERLALATEYRDDDTLQHTQRVGRTAALLADVLGLSAGDVSDIRAAAPLHDVGKIALPDALLTKRGKLTPVEFETMKTHTTVGSRLLRDSGSSLLMRAEEVARTHHERWDGRGYPAGLAGEDIPLAGRLASIADVFDVLTHHRPYREARAVDEAVAEIGRLSGTAFDPRVVSAFDELDHTRLLTPVGST